VDVFPDLLYHLAFLRVGP